MTTPLAALCVALVALIASYSYICHLEDKIHDLQIEKSVCNGCYRCMNQGISMSYKMAVDVAEELERLGSNMNLAEPVNHGVKRMKTRLESCLAPGIVKSHYECHGCGKTLKIGEACFHV